jgi:uncharacterized integral membrane protein (TIGR00697 family)
MNEFLLITTLFLALGMVILFYKYLGKNGLFSWIVVATLISNIQTAKTIVVFGFTTTLGTILHGSTCLATDIINYKYGKKESEKTIIYSFLSMIVMTMFMTLAILYVPSVGDFAHYSLVVLFTFNIRITIASLLGFFISQLVDIRLFHYLQNKHKKIWLSTNLSTLVSQGIDTSIFVFIVFFETMTFKSIVEVAITMYTFKFFISFFDIPFMYIADKIKVKKEF